MFRRQHTPRSRLATIMIATSVGMAGVVGAFATSLTASASDADAITKNAGAPDRTNYPVPANAIFVSPKGKPGATGTEDDPMFYLEQAIDAANNGDTIVMRGGMYRQAIPKAITKRLTIQAYPKEKPVLTGADEWTNWVKIESGWKAEGWVSPFAKSTAISNAIRTDYPVADDVEQVFRNGARLQQVSRSEDLNGDTFLLDPTTREITVAQDPTGATMEISMRASAMTLAASDPGTTVRGLTFTSYAARNAEGQAMLVSRAAGLILENTLFTNSSGAGVYVNNSNGFRVTNSTFSKNGATGLFGEHVENAIIERSLFRENNKEHFRSESCEGPCTVAGAYFRNAAGAQLLNNVFTLNDSIGLWCESSCDNVMIHSNVAKQNGRGGIVYDNSKGAAMLENHLLENSIEGISLTNANTVAIRKSVFDNNKLQLRIREDNTVVVRDRLMQPDGSWKERRRWRGEQTNDRNRQVLPQVGAISIVDNKINGGNATTRLLESNTKVATTFAEFANNKVEGTESIETVVKTNVQSFDTIAAFATATNLPVEDALSGAVYKPNNSTTTANTDTSTQQALGSTLQNAVPSSSASSDLPAASASSDPSTSTATSSSSASPVSPSPLSSSASTTSLTADTSPSPTSGTSTSQSTSATSSKRIPPGLTKFLATPDLRPSTPTAVPKNR